MTITIKHNDHNGEQTITIFQIMHFKEPVIREETQFFVTYSCVGVLLGVLMLSGYNIISL